MGPNSSEARSFLPKQIESEPSSFSKRSLLKAAWVPPVIFAISLPHASYAANISGTGKDRNEGKDDKWHGGGSNKGPGEKK